MIEFKDPKIGRTTPYDLIELETLLKEAGFVQAYSWFCITREGVCRVGHGKMAAGIHAFSLEDTYAILTNIGVTEIEVAALFAVHGIPETQAAVFGILKHAGFVETRHRYFYRNDGSIMFDDEDWSSTATKPEEVFGMLAMMRVRRLKTLAKKFGRTKKGTP